MSELEIVGGGTENREVIQVVPYIMDLESEYGTFVNGERIEEAKYI